MLEKVRATIKKFNMLNLDDSIVVGLSGGPDSVVLLHVLISLKLKFNLKIYAAHVNHQLRGLESLQDESYVRDLCKRWGIPLFVKSIDIKKEAEEKKLTLEEAGRNERYSFFNEVLIANSATKIAVAHNANDNAETVLMRIIRGSGIEGLVGIKPIRDNIIRPLIEVERTEIEEYCINNMLNPRVDSSNLKSDYTRNKIRLELLPYLKENFNNNIIDNLNRLSKLVSDDNCFIDESIKKIFKDILFNQSDEYITINIDKINKYNISVTSRLIRECIYRLTGSLEGIYYSNIDECINFILSENPSGTINLPKGLLLKKNYNQITISKLNHKKTTQKYNYYLEIPGKIFISEINGYIQASIEQNINTQSLDKFTQTFDYDKIKDRIQVRSRQNGDIIKPKGMVGTKKLKELFIDLKISREQRDEIPLIAVNNEIVWAIGYRSSEKYKVDSNTKSVLLIKYIEGNTDCINSHP